MPNKKSSASTSIFIELKTDHDCHRNMLKRIKEEINNPNVCRELFSNFSLEVKAHALAEEQALYSSLMKKPEFTADARHSVAEHKEIEDAINELAERKAIDDTWINQFKILEKDYLHHINEEEKELFIKAQKNLSASEQKNMGELFEKRKPIEKSSATVGEEE